jgi:chromosome partitioning protein
MTYRIAVANEKGGVGKTTSVLSLGAALSESGSRVLLADLDPQANLTLSLGGNPRKIDLTISGLLMGKDDLTAVARKTKVDSLALIPANHELMLAERYLSVRKEYYRLLDLSLQQASDFDFIIIDCPPSLGPLTRSALMAADLLIIPTQCEYYSAHALRNVLDLIRVVRQHGNPDLRYRLLLTMVDASQRLQGLQEQLRKAFGHAVFETMIEVDEQLRESPAHGQPITVFSPDSRGAGQYRKLAQEMRQHVQQTLQSPA